MKAVWRLALRDLRFNKVRAIFGALLIGIPTMAALVIGSVTAVSGSRWMIDDLDYIEDLQGAGWVACDCEIRQDPEQLVMGLLSERPVEDGDAVQKISEVVSDRNTVELLDSQAAFTVRKSDEYNFIHGLAQQASSNPSLIVEGRLPATPDEVAISKATRDAMDVNVGDTIELLGNDMYPRAVVVTGLTDQVNLVATVDGDTGSSLHVLSRQSWGISQIAISGPDPVTWEQVKELNRLGVAFTSIHVLDNPPSQAEVDAWMGAETIGDQVNPDLLPMITIAAIGILEVLLLVSPPFTMAVKRNERALGQLAALGATRGQLRSLMLYQGVILGLSGAVVGIVGFFIFRLLVDSLTGGSLLLVLWHLPIAVIIAVILGLAAALIPAFRSSRIDVVQALTGREMGRAMRGTRNYFGLVVLVAGIVMLIFAGNNVNNILLSIGLLVTVLGLIFTAPACVRLTGCLVGKLGLEGKLAGRDAVRNVHRTAPGVAAVMIVTIVSTLVISYFSTILNRAFDEENIAGPRGAVWVTMTSSGAGGNDEERLEEAMAELDDYRSIKQWTPVYVVGAGDAYVEPRVPEDRLCPINEPDWQVGLTPEEVDERIEASQTDPRCEYQNEELFESNMALPDFLRSGLAIADDGTILSLLPGVDDVELGKEVLEEGGVLVDTIDPIVGGLVDLDFVSYANDAENVRSSARVRSESVLGSSGLYLMLSREAAEELGLDPYPVGALVEFENPVGILESNTIRRDSYGWDDIWISNVNEVDTGVLIGTLITAFVSAIVAVGSSIVVVVLSGRESRGDFDTIDAIGGKPSLRRKVSVAMGGILTLAGVVPGMIVGFILTRALGQIVLGYSLDVAFLPVLGLGLIMVAVSLLASALLAPRRRSLTRRID